MGREQARPRTGHGRHSSNLGDVDEEDEEDLSMNSNMLLNGSSKSQFHDSMDFDLHNSVTGSQRGGGGGGNDLFENTQKGDKIISASRCIFFSVLFVAAAVLATVAFLLYRQEETETFERAFTNQAEEIMLYTNHNVDTAFATLRGLSTSTTTMVKRMAESGIDNPGFIVIPDLDDHMGLARETTDALVMAYMPMVKNASYDAWIEFSEENKMWVSEYQPGGPVDYAPEITPYIWEWADQDTRYNVSHMADEVGSEYDAKRNGTTDTTTITVNGGDTEGKDKNKNTEPVVEETETDDSKPETTADAIIETEAKEKSAETENGTKNDTSTPDTHHYSPNRSLRRSPGCTDEHFGRRRQMIQSHHRSLNIDQYDEKAFDDKAELVKENLQDTEVKIPSLRNATYYAPVWQLVPVPIINETHPGVEVINYNLLDRGVFERAVDYMDATRLPLFLDVCDQSAWFGVDGNSEILQTVVAFPVFENFEPDADIAAFYTAIIPWAEFFGNPSNSVELGEAYKNVTIVVENDCDEVFTVNLGNGETFIDPDEDLHDPNYDFLSKSALFAPEYNNRDSEDFAGEICIYTMTIYPTKSFEDAYRTNRPAVISMMIVLVFLFTSMAFMLFDCLVTRRQAKLLNTALRQNAIVSSLFPKSVQKKLMEEAEVKAKGHDGKGKINPRSLGAVLTDDGIVKQKAITLDSKPIADLFPKTTIMFADIAGFTAWSSARDPEAVFTLLETIYRAFDMIAKRRRVFKVETIGDCYVAVCGLPDPRKDHFSVMCRFAQDCLNAMNSLVKELEVQLGPDTGDLRLRTGLHSGPIVAGVLRGEKARFQLFGDTMNTASRMESTGIPSRIQLSQSTADLLIDAGKEHWITKRPDKVKAKGKGELTTYFLLEFGKKSSQKARGGVTESIRDKVILGHKNNSVDEKGNTATVKRVQKRNRVADWVVEMLGKLLKEMKEKRELTGIRQASDETMSALEHDSEMRNAEDGTVIDDVADVLRLPVYSATVGAAFNAKGGAQLSQDVMDELQDYVYSIASMYPKNPFHNFEHASHVSMSCIKLLNRIASREEDYQDGTDHTYGICSDPLTAFAIVFSALIHDVDHTGVPNVQLVKEHSPIAAAYKNKSVAEQNSIDVGWGLLMEPSYKNLRRHIYTTKDEYTCFRQLVINCVMATDICDKDLIKARNQRWEIAFDTDNKPSGDDDGAINPGNRFESVRQVNNRKGTVVIEHLIQLSDVSHTMQHWHIYRRWNERLFEESYVAYADCRSDNNPSQNWYQGELGFYDFYIIPLAKKIKQCQVFGVSSDEYLSYALQNRAEWEERGKELVEEMTKKMEATHHAGISRQLLELEMGVAVTAESMNKGARIVKRFDH